MFVERHDVRFENHFTFDIGKMHFSVINIDIGVMFSKRFLVIEFCIVSVHQIYTKIHTSFFGTLVHNVQYSRKFAYLLPSRSRNVQ